MPSIINSDNGSVSGSAGLKFDSADDGILHIQNSGNTSVVVSESGMRVPIGTTAERPASPQNGTIRYNTDTLELEAYANGSWKSVAGVEPALKLDFDQYQFDGRISFTRATNGTYFDRNGVLTTAGSGVARFDHRLEGGVWVNKGLLIEEARTNLNTYSEDLSNAAWFKANLTVSTNSTQAPNGEATADTVTETTTNGLHRFYKDTGFSAASDTSATFSIFLKANGSNTVLVTIQNISSINRGIYVNLSNGASSAYNTPTAFNVENVGNGWYRISVTANTGGSGTYYGIVWMTNGFEGVTSYAGSTSNSIFVFGAQMEAGAFPTSYIGTTSASVTRNADVASMTSTNFSSWYNQTEGTVFWQGDIVGSSAVAKRAFEFSDGTNNERILVTAEDGSGNGFLAFVSDNNVAQASLQTPNPSTPRTPFQTYKHSFAYKVNDFAASLDGLAVQTDTSGTIPTVNTLSIGWSTAIGTLQLNGHIAKFYYWPNRLPNSKLQSLTS